jgi:hypothetical protein
MPCNGPPMATLTYCTLGAAARCFRVDATLEKFIELKRLDKYHTKKIYSNISKISLPKHIYKTETTTLVLKIDQLIFRNAKNIYFNEKFPFL